MQIVICPDAARRTIKKWGKPARVGFTGHEMKYLDMIRKIEGKTIDVETKYLFKDQYNTVPIEGVTELGLRVYDYQVEKVIDDVRGAYCERMV